MSEVGAALLTTPYAIRTLVRLVEDFGADPTGSVDSTTAFQNAIARTQGFGANGGGAIVVAQGQYKCNISLASVWDILFIALGRVTLVANNTAVDTLSISGTTGGVTFDGFWYCNGPTTGAGLHINVSSVHQNRWLTFRNWYGQGGVNAVKVDNSAMTTFDNLLLTGTSAEGMLLSPAGNINDVWIKNLLGGPAGQTAIRVRSGIGFRVDKVDIEATGTGIVMDPPVGSTVELSSIAHAGFSTCTGDGITLGGGGGNVNDTQLIDIYVNGATANGIRALSGVNRCYLTDPNLVGNGVEGVFLNDPSITDFKIRGGRIVGNVSAGVAVNAAVQGWSVIGSTVTGNPTNIFTNAVAMDHYAVVYNDLAGAGFVDSGTGTHKLVTPNY